MPAPLVLAFDTSAAHCAAALLRGDTLLAALQEPMEKGQAERLMPLLTQMLATSACTWRDLSAIAVGTGPGNFTGVRIAVAAARGLSLALGIPAIGVSRFDALTFGLAGPVWVVEDAKRGEFYLQAPGEMPRLASLAEAQEIPSGAVLIGSGAETVLSPHTRQTPPRYPLAEAIARVATTRLSSQQPRPAPFYLRGADAAPPSDPPPVILP